MEAQQARLVTGVCCIHVLQQLHFIQALVKVVLVVLQYRQ